MAALSLALPQFRNSAPLAPPVGCLMDWASYFFCVCIAILSFTGIFSTLITQSPQVGGWPQSTEALSLR